MRWVVFRILTIKYKVKIETEKCEINIKMGIGRQ
jgi:hypothetical protein